ncbi:hypothetical protein CLV78_101837 [Aliiruegeria haliotis]|uniref:Secreted protein n=1 Tax=Aliiruegeria haliotis TaxID=1280846 RepID=A0A2T0RZX9_9RHOB|nr:DUF1223 domain-containing protein [Aliiruegeria haliotis]PRY26736.1 hypothetical protein CLV78_101837 [Aliiruegeria haliotis]
MKRNTLLAGLFAGAALLGAVATAVAEPRNLVVVELFTSQGCSSCPPADELLTRMAARDDVLPLALHVDYWDYIGWADSFARPEHTKRQKAYAHVAGSRTIYTPQMIVSGDEQIVGTRPMELADAIMKHAASGPIARVSAERDGDRLQVVVPAVTLPGGTAVLQLVRFMPEKTVRIDRGENQGKTISYSNIVTAWDVVGEWSGEADLVAEVPVPGPEAAAVILQAAGHGRILGAARVD